MSDFAIKFKLRHLFVAMTVIAILLGGVSLIFEFRSAAKRKAAQTAAQAVEVAQILNEVTHRTELARSTWTKSPQRAQDYLNGMVSGDTTNLRLYRLPLSALIDRLETLNYDFNGVDVDQLESQANRLDPDQLPDLLLLMDQAFPR